MVYRTWLGEDLQSWVQGIRNGYARAFIVFALHETGVFQALRRGGPKTVENLASECGVNAHLLDGVLNFIAFADEIIAKKGDEFSLTEYGDWLFSDQVLAMSYGAVGAYSCILSELVPALRGQKRYGVDFERRGDLVAKGSYYTGRGNYPWVVSELSRLGVQVVADLGCGSAEVLIAFCNLNPKLRGVGIDISHDALKEARRHVEAAGLADRVTLLHGDMTRPETFADKVSHVEAFNGIMAFHEFLRDGEDAVVGILQRMKQRFPGRYLLIGEFNRVSDQEFEAMPFPGRIHLLFYQYLIHPLTWQGLPMPKANWLRLFEQAGLEIINVKDDFPFRLVEYVLRF